MHSWCPCSLALYRPAKPPADVLIRSAKCLKNNIIYQNSHCLSPCRGGMALACWGAPLVLTIANEAGRHARQLGTDLSAGARPQAVVPAGAWQRAESLGPWTLVGCTLAP